MGYSPGGHKESDMTKQLSTAHKVTINVYLVRFKRHCGYLINRCDLSTEQQTDSLGKFL